MKEKDIEKIYNSIIKFIFIILLIAFIALYISDKTGYYEVNERKKAVLTEEKIKQFEEDIKNGKNVDLETYLENTKVNYNNKTSRLGLFLSDKIGEYVRDGIEVAFGALNEIIKE